MKLKKYRLEVRLSEMTLRKLLAICQVTGKNKTAAIEELIDAEYHRKKVYMDQYHKNLGREL